MTPLRHYRREARRALAERHSGALACVTLFLAALIVVGLASFAAHGMGAVAEWQATLPQSTTPEGQEA